MIVVKIELWPVGREDRAREIGRMYVANIGGDRARGDYKVAVCRRGQHACPWPHGLDADAQKTRPAPTRTAVVRDYPRRSYTVWRLILRALRGAFPEER